MKLEFELIDSLPRLAWCARVRLGEDVVFVRHGPWVETREDCFFEGAWDGPFESSRFDEAVMLAGSGGRLTQEGIVFAAPNHMLERIQSIRVGEELYVSNSFTFLLVQAGDEPDINYPDYFFDLLNYYRAGIRMTDKRIRLRGQRYVHLHDCCNIVVKPDLTISRFEKRLSNPPANYTDYVAFLEGTLQRIIRNAGHPTRKQIYRPITTISLGYDSTAVSVLASRAGCSEAVTFRKSVSAVGYVEDSGTAIAAYLGLQTTEYERLDFNKLPGLPDAEFYLNPFLTDRSMLVMEDQLVGSLLMTGRNGENFWSTDKQAHPLLQEPTAVLMSGTTLVEFRLRAGVIHLPVPYCGALHCSSIHRITLSPEMKPWSVGGNYDRPIPRRIIEEAGVPRELFGRRKQGGHGWLRNRDLSSASEHDFLDFYYSKVRQKRYSKLYKRGFEGAQRYAVRCLRLIGSPLRRTNVHRIMSLLVGVRLHPMWGSKYLYTFHWGFSRTKERYESALSKSLDIVQDNKPAARISGN
jgi:hypothetical protein